MEQPDSSEQRPDWLRRRRDLVEVGAAVAFFIGLSCGVTGFLLSGPPGIPWWQAVADAFYKTLQLAVLEGDAGETSRGWLGVARFLLPASVSVALITLVWDSWIQWWLRMVRLPRRDPRRVLIVGCGWIGSRMGAFYKAAGANVVGVDRNVQGEHTGAFRALRAPILDAEASAGKRALAAASATRAARVVVCVGNDAAGLQIAAKVVRAALEERGVPHRRSAGSSDFDASPRVLVAIQDTRYAQAADFDPLLAQASAAGAVEFFDIARTRARRLFANAAPHLLHPGRFGAGRTNRCHVLFYGAAAMVEPFVLYAARALVYDPEEPLRITVFGADAGDAKASFVQRHPAFGEPADGVAGTPAGDDPYDGQRPIARVHFEPVEHTQIGVDALRRVHAEQPIDVVYVIGGDEVEGRLMTVEMLRGADFLLADGAQGPAVVVCSRESGPPRSDAGEPTPIGVPLLHFDVDAWSRGAPAGAAAQPVPNDDNDRLARHIKDVYDRSLEPPREQPWSRTSDDERWWNRYAADHASIKLALIGLLPDRGTAGNPADAADAAGDEAARAAIERHRAWLAALEHRRYVCERLVDGWLRRLPAAGQTRDKLTAYRLNPTLVRLTSGALPEDELNKDRRIVDGLLEAWRWKRAHR